MANHPSAKKRYRRSQKKRISNRSARTAIRTLVRKVNEAIARGEAGEAKTTLGTATRALAKGAAKGILHPANAARRSSRLAIKVARLG